MITSSAEPHALAQKNWTNEPPPTSQSTGNYSSDLKTRPLGNEVASHMIAVAGLSGLALKAEHGGN